MLRSIPCALALLLCAPAFMADASAAEGARFSWGAHLPQWSSYSDITRPAALDAATSSGMTLIGTDAKDGGNIGWATSAYPTVAPYAPGDGAVERVLRDAHARGLTVTARFDAFWDLTAAAALPGAKIGGSTWVDPGCASVRAYVLAELRDFLVHDAPDELTLDHIRYPESADVFASAALPCTGGTLGTVGATDRVALITSFVQDAVNVAHEVRPGMPVSVSVYAPSVSRPLPLIGQDAARLAPLVDLLRPMEYPSYLGAESTPYSLVYADTAAAVQKFGSKIQPWVEAFGAYSTRADIVCQEIKAVADAGAHGAMVWWFWSAGTTAAFWNQVASCVPASGTPPAPAPSVFSATFATRARGHIAVTVVGNQTVASVCAQVNAGPCSPLAGAGNVWSSATYPPRWSHVVFVARNATGVAVASRAFTWK
jgi:hypothetical protein